jgi:hypothetical protein
MYRAELKEMTKSMVPPSKNNGSLLATTESVADVLEREMDFVIHDWMEMAEKQEDLMRIPLNFDERTRHLPQLLRDVIARLRLNVCTKARLSTAASHHGGLRRKQGYTVAMAVEESRLLQVCLFNTLHKGSGQLDYTKLLPDVVTIADEVDAQLKQPVVGYMASSRRLETYLWFRRRG